MATLLTRGEAAERLRLSEATVRRLARRGHLHEVRVSERAVRVDEDSVEHLAARGLGDGPKDAA